MVVDLSAEVSKADKCVLYTKTDKGLEYRSSIGFKGVGKVILNQPASDDPEFLADVVLRKSRSIVIEDLANEKRFSIPSFVLQSGKIASYLGIPLKIGAGVIGVLEVYSKEPRSFKTDELRQYSAFSAQAAMAIQNAILLEAAGRRERQLKLFRGLTELGNSSAQKSDITQTATAMIASILRCESAVLFGEADSKILYLHGTYSEQKSEDLQSLILELNRENPVFLRVSQETVSASRSEFASQFLNVFGQRSGLYVASLHYGILLLRELAQTAFDEEDAKIVHTALGILAGAISISA
jgi:hypothetical protein